MNAASVSAVVAALALLLSLWNAFKKDTKDNTKEMTMVITKLDGLSDDMREIKRDMNELRASIQDDHDRIIKLEEAMSSLRVQVEHLK